MKKSLSLEKERESCAFTFCFGDISQNIFSCVLGEYYKYKNKNKVKESVAYLKNNIFIALFTILMIYHKAKCIYSELTIDMKENFL